MIRRRMSIAAPVMEPNTKLQFRPRKFAPLKRPHHAGTVYQFRGTAPHAIDPRQPCGRKQRAKSAKHLGLDASSSYATRASVALSEPAKHSEENSQMRAATPSQRRLTRLTLGLSPDARKGQNEAQTEVSGRPSPMKVPLTNLSGKVCRHTGENQW